MASPWSLDALVMARPARTFQSVANRIEPIGARAAWRRPLFLAFALGCIVSLATSGTLTVRLAASAMSYWALVPAIETLALAMVIRRRRARVPLPEAIDLFFAGHAPWTLLLLGIGASFAFLPPWAAWTLLLRFWVWTMLVVIGWSAWIDFHFFRWVIGETRGASLRDVALVRALTWTVVVALFAWPSMNLEGVRETVSEILR